MIRAAVMGFSIAAMLVVPALGHAQENSSGFWPSTSRTLSGIAFQKDRGDAQSESINRETAEPSGRFVLKFGEADVALSAWEEPASSELFLDDEPYNEGERRTYGGAALEGGMGDLGYSVEWYGSWDGSVGALSLRRGGASLSLSRDFGQGGLSPEPTLTARWRHDMTWGGLDLRLDGQPGSREATTQLQWTLDW